MHKQIIFLLTIFILTVSFGFSDDGYLSKNKFQSFDKVKAQNIMGRDRGSRWGGVEGFFSMDSLDKDNDGKISKEEFDAPHNAMYADMDKDNNDEISKQEFEDFSIDKAKQMSKLRYVELSDSSVEKIRDEVSYRFERIDDDNNGSLSKDEFFGDRGENMFNRLDRDDDGYISEEEHQKFSKKWDKRGNGRWDDDRRGRDDRGRWDDDKRDRRKKEY